MFTVPPAKTMQIRADSTNLVAVASGYNLTGVP